MASGQTNDLDDGSGYAYRDCDPHCAVGGKSTHADSDGREQCRREG